jgi:hypothetical protein
LVVVGLAACSSPSEPRAGGVNPCALVSPSLLSSVFSARFGGGKPVLAGGDGYDNCEWDDASDPAQPESIMMRVASDQSLVVANSGYLATSVPPCRSGCASSPALRPLSASSAYHDDFAAHPERWQLQSVSGLGQHAKEALALPSPTVANDPVLAPHLLGSAQLDVLSGHWLVTVQYLGAAAGSAEVAPELEMVARHALTQLPAHVRH